NSDAAGLSSFNTGANWDSGSAPTTGSPNFNAYFTTNTLRTPPDANNYSFAGDSLEVSTNGGVLGIKGSGVITRARLILSGGKVSNSGTGASPDTAVLAGNVTLQVNSVTSTSALDGGGTAGVTALNVLAKISGPGSVSIQNNGTVIFSTNNVYSGNTS